ncbi:hypothetical protein EVAR_68301_1 [Eumeta japonica]|uniref:Uncharacterized protein n=1 Tax=Eumeta variegata TaxID=151549 RepID=A0A4C2AAE4_EUMVA|nr:hypothetical protein EVAR_68301_1 [Eumeta japonica]
MPQNNSSVTAGISGHEAFNDCASRRRSSAACVEAGSEPGYKCLEFSSEQYVENVDDDEEKELDAVVSKQQ